MQIHKEERNHQHQQIKVEFKQEKQENEKLKSNNDAWWIIHFDGAMSEKRVGACSWISPPKGRTDYPSLCSYKLYFECTNNVA